MSIKKYYFIILAIIFTISCDAAIINPISNAYELFGYYSKYTGATNEAELPARHDLITIATTIQPAIDYANAISLYLIPALTPEILTDNSSIPNYGTERRDNSTCFINDSTITDDTTYRIYDQSDINKLTNIILYDDQLDFRDYCVQNQLLPTTTKATLDGYPVETEMWIDNNTLNYYIRFEKMTAKIIDPIGNLTSTHNIFGILEKVSQLNNVNNATYKLGLDIAGTDNKTNRFDFNFDSNGMREITFYHDRYGYVTASLNGINAKLTDTNYVTFKYKNNECTYRKRDIEDDPLDFDAECPKN